MIDYVVPVISGGFDPIHSGHIALIEDAARKYEQSGVAVLLNSDEWLTRKKGKPFMPFAERMSILQSLKHVDFVTGFDDTDGSACDGLLKLKKLLPHAKLVFCNGGDRTANNIPEMKVEGIRFDFGIGGEDKRNSSSWILSNALALYKEDRIWGSFTDLYRVDGCRIKELIIKPGKGISYQKHNHRSEVWYVRKGRGRIRLTNPDISAFDTTFDVKQDHVQEVPCGWWHKLWNTGEEDLIIIEIQHGKYIGEDDIIRSEK